MIDLTIVFNDVVSLIDFSIVGVTDMTIMSTSVIAVAEKSVCCMADSTFDLVVELLQTCECKLMIDC